MIFLGGFNWRIFLRVRFDMQKMTSPPGSAHEALNQLRRSIQARWANSQMEPTMFVGNIYPMFLN